jgi:hypothetical protein
MKRVILITLVMLLAVIFAVSAFADDSRFDFSRKTVEDKRTGLIWMRDADLGRLDWVGASDLIERLNKNEYAGFNDWRLPSRDELDTLVTYARRVNYSGGVDAFSPYQMFNQLGFNDVHNYWYWTSSPYEGNTTYSWAISMYNGDARGESKESSLNVWPVRGGK